MFRGISPITLDVKGRMSIPVRYRSQLQDVCAHQLVITIDPDYCLLLYPLPAWEVVEQRLVCLSSTNRKARSLKRLLLGHAEECHPDSHGRLLLPMPLREFAGLDRRAVLVGQGNKFEIWDEALWYRQRDEWIRVQDGDDPQSDVNTLAF